MIPKQQNPARKVSILARVWKRSVRAVLLGLVCTIAIPAMQAAEPADASRQADQPVAPKRRAKARVLTPEGNPIEGARIEPYCDVKNLDGTSQQWTFGSILHQVTSTDDEGVFKYTAQGCDRVGVRVIAPGYARKMVEVPYGNQTLDIVLGKGMTVTGRLLKDGNPVPDIEVGIVQTDRASQTFLEEIVVKTDGSGRFTLRDVAPHQKYEIHAKRDSLKLLGVTGEIEVTSGAPETTLEAGDLVVVPGIKLTGRLMLANGQPATPKSETKTAPDGSTYLSGQGPVQLHITREKAFDFQYINLEPDLRFTVLAGEKEELHFSAWVDGYELREWDNVLQLHESSNVLKVVVKPGLGPIEMVYVPK